jgi:hypothetical protein
MDTPQAPQTKNWKKNRIEIWRRAFGGIVGCVFFFVYLTLSTEGVGEDISLTFGSYSYTVYASDGNLITTGKPILEVGLMIVPKEQEVFNSFTSTKDTQVYGIEIPVIQS